MGGSLTLGAIMEELASKVRDSDDPENPGPDAILPNAYGWPISTWPVPCFAVGYPEATTLDAAFRRGFDQVTIPAWAILGDPHAPATRDMADDFLLGLKTALDGPGATYSSARVASVAFETVTPEEGGIYLSVRLSIDIAT